MILEKRGGLTMYKFKASVKCDFISQTGTNLSVKGLNGKVILKPQDSAEFEKEQDDKTLTFTLTPSSLGTEKRSVKVEVKNGTENTTTSAAGWEVKITASSDPVEINVEATEEFH